MTEENKRPSPENESENSSQISDLTDQDLEQVSGGLNSPSTGQHLTKATDKWKGNNLGNIKPLIYDDESPKET